MTGPIRILVVLALAACANARPRDVVKDKFNDLGRKTKSVAKHWAKQIEKKEGPKLPTEKLSKIPHHIKNRTRPVAIPKVDSAIPMSMLGGCGRKLAAKNLKKSAQAAKLWKNSFLQMQGALRGQKAPEHPGAESYAVPGAGATQVMASEGKSTPGSVDGQEPYVTVLKDGFFEVGCFFDTMLSAGDMYGNDKDKYNMGHANVAIALYDELLLGEDKEPMTP